MRLSVGTEPGRCLCCGSHVTPQFRRGYGDEDDRAHRCRRCDVDERLSAGSAAGKDVPKPDPLEDPSRFQPAFEDLPENVKAVCQPVATDGGEVDG
ncbi:DUF7563 family protein [Natrinema ejinorense]